MTRSVRFHDVAPRHRFGSVVVSARARALAAARPAAGRLPRTGDPAGRRATTSLHPHPPDQAHHRHRTGEPLLRQLLRRTGCRRHPRAERTTFVVVPVRPVDARRPTTTRRRHGGGPAGEHNAKLDVNGGKMDGSSPRPTSGKKGAAPTSTLSTTRNAPILRHPT